jgi:trehalose 6-phosphate phosphatase
MVPILPPPRDVALRGALLLDFDGTLVDLAPHPDAVLVPGELAPLLARLHERLDGAVGVISGRALPVLDRFLAPLVLPAAGEHGIILRPDPRLPARRHDVPAMPASWHAVAARIVEDTPGAHVEHKPSGFVVHYRAAPRAGAMLHAQLQSLVETDARFMLQTAHMAVELRPRGPTKGSALCTLMEAPAFQHRVPLFIGDDATDEHAIRAAIALGGQGLRMHESFGTPAGLRGWLGRILEHDDAAAA